MSSEKMNMASVPKNGGASTCLPSTHLHLVIRFSYQWDLLLAGPCRRMSAGSWLTWALIAAQLEIWPTFFRSGTGHRCCFSCRFCLWLDSGPFYGLSFGSAFTDANVSGRVPVNLEIRMHHNTRSLKIDCFPNWKKKIWIYYRYIWYIYIWYKSRDWPSTREVITWNAQVTCRWISMATAAKNCWWPNGVSKNWGAKGGCCSVNCQCGYWIRTY